MTSWNEGGDKGEAVPVYVHEWARGIRRIRIATERASDGPQSTAPPEADSTSAIQFRSSTQGCRSGSLRVSEAGGQPVGQGFWIPSHGSQVRRFVDGGAGGRPKGTLISIVSFILSGLTSYLLFPYRLSADLHLNRRTTDPSDSGPPSSSLSFTSRCPRTSGSSPKR